MGDISRIAEEVAKCNIASNDHFTVRIWCTEDPKKKTHYKVLISYSLEAFTEKEAWVFSYAMSHELLTTDDLLYCYGVDLVDSKEVTRR